MHAYACKEAAMNAVVSVEKNKTIVYSSEKNTQEERRKSQAKHLSEQITGTNARFKVKLFKKMLANNAITFENNLCIK